MVGRSDAGRAELLWSDAQHAVSTGPVGQLVEHRSLDVGHVTTATAKRERTGRFLFSRRKWKLRD